MECTGKKMDKKPHVSASPADIHAHYRETVMFD